MFHHFFAVVVVFTLKAVPVSTQYLVLSNIRTGPTDADAFRGHRLTTQKGCLSARCLSSFTGRFNRPTPSDSTPSSRLWCIPTQCAALPFLFGLSPLRSPLLHSPGVHAGALGFNPMLLPKLDQREIPRSRDRGNSYRSNPGSPSIRGSGSCLRLCRVVFACYTPTGGSRPTTAGAGQGGVSRYYRRGNNDYNIQQGVPDY